MSNSIETESDTISPGNIKFYDAIQPPLSAGEYTLKGTQTIHGVVEGGPDPEYVAVQAFSVVAPQFSIDPSMIHSVYPPKGQTGNYYKQLPFIVFNNFALPWARNIDPNVSVDAKDAPPWMGVLLVYAEDMEGCDPKVGKPMTIDASAVTTPAAGVLVPDIPADAISTAPDDRAVAVEMKLDYFLAIAPTLAELPLLGHGRGVNTDGKVMLGMDADGLFSVVVSNRVPPAKGGACTAFLVSLEGHQAHLPSAGGKASASAGSRIRLVVLGSWSFTASDQPGSFLTLMENLADQGGVELLQAPGDPSTVTDATAKKALEIGYVALPNDMRVGEKTTSWYRGPCVPSPTLRDTSNAPYHYSDHAMHYDPETGLFDLSYAAAWQVGRLLALSDGPFAQMLGSWRQSYLQALQAAKEADDSDSILASPLAFGADEAEAVATGPVGRMRGFMYALAAADEPVFPRLVVRSPLAASTRPTAEEALADLESTGDPLLDLLARDQDAGGEQ